MRNPTNLDQFRGEMLETLRQVDAEDPANTSLILLSHALNRPKAWILAHGEYTLSTEENHTLQNYLKQFLQGVPLPYILGHWSFYGREFTLTPDVLIPRPETELLVELALDHIKQMENPKVIDVGTGSGAIAVSLAAECPAARVYAVDISRPALTIAKLNANRLGQPRINFVQADLLSPIHGMFDLIAANLPYIPTRTLEQLPALQSEPRLALDGGADGLQLINILLDQARTRLSAKGVVLLEIESTLGEESLTATQRAFPEAERRLIPDLTGRDRIVEIRRR